MGKKILIWGTGNIAGIFMHDHPDINPEFFIDSNKEKNHSIYLNKEVLLPEEILDWTEYEVIIATDYYVEIVHKYAELLKQTKVCSYKEYMESTEDRLSLVSEIEMFLKKIDENRLKKSVLFFGDVVGYDKGICNYLNCLSKQNDFILFSEADGVSDKYVEEKIHFPFLRLPKLLIKNYVCEKNHSSDVNDDMRELVKDKEYLSKACLNLRLRHKNLGAGVEILFSYYAYECIKRILDVFCPRCVMLWNEFSALHIIIDAMCREKGVEVCYMEFGVLPGSFTIETDGQMGESYPAKECEHFNSLNVEEREIKRAIEIIDFLRDNDFNRHKQEDISELFIIKQRLKYNRPIIFVAGQNDYESSLQPFDDNTKKYHSPTFESTNESVQFIAELAKRNDWNVIYKPHPIMTRFSSTDINVPNEVIVVYHCNVNRLIDLCDVCVTILSQVSYMALIRNTATLMLGYNQLKGSGAIYSAFEKSDIEKKLMDAINNGYTSNQKKAFIKHVARLCKYYLYDDMNDKAEQIGRNIETFNLI